MDAPPGFVYKLGKQGKFLANLVDDEDDQPPLGFESSSKVDPLQKFYSNCQWEYMDPQGAAHGTFSARKILSWYAKGHYDLNLKVRPVAPWITLGEILKFLEKAAQDELQHGPGQKEGATRAEVKPPATTANGAVAQMQKHEVPGAQRGPPTVLGAGAGPAPSSSTNAAVTTRALKKLAVTAPAGTAAPHEVLPPSWGEQLFTGGVSQPEGQPIWRYIDQQGVIQGPFTSGEMLTWFSSNLFPEDVPMCGVDRTVDHITPGRAFFRPLKELLEDIKRGARYQPVRLEDLHPGKRSAGGQGGGGWGALRSHGEVAEGQGDHGAEGHVAHHRRGGGRMGGAPGGGGRGVGGGRRGEGDFGNGYSTGLPRGGRGGARSRSPFEMAFNPNSNNNDNWAALQDPVGLAGAKPPALGKGPVPSGQSPPGPGGLMSTPPAGLMGPAVAPALHTWASQVSGEMSGELGESQNVQALLQKAQQQQQQLQKGTRSELVGDPF